MNRPKRPWTTKQIQLVKDLYAEGKTVREIAEALPDRISLDVQNLIARLRDEGSTDFPYRVTREVKKKPKRLKQKSEKDSLFHHKSVNKEETQR